MKLQSPLTLTPASKLYVKTVALFWTYENIRKDDNNYFSVDKKKVMLNSGYWTFKQLRQKLESHGLVVEDFPDGRIKIGLGKSVKSFNPWKLGRLLGYTTFSELHPSQHPVDIHQGLRYVTIGCNLANRSQNINPDGNPSSIISSLPIDATKPLFGTTTKYNDIESEVQADAGIYDELHFDMEKEEQVLRDYYGKNYEKVRKAYPLEIQKLKTNFLKKYPDATLSKFEFNVTFVKDGTLSSTGIFYKERTTTETWKRRTLSSHANIGTWYYRLAADTRRKIRNRHYVRTPHGGTFIEYEYLTKRLPKNVTEDYKIFIPKTSHGLTRIGQRLFQQSLEVYVYAVLGSQAKTRWSITGQGAKSLQTQDVFRKVLKDSILVNEITTIIRNMRTSIADTNVVLNFAIMPGLILIPSDMRILQKPLKGYSNILTLAKSGMSFGKNDEVNFTKTPTSPATSPVEKPTSPAKHPVTNPAKHPVTNPTETSTSPTKTSTTKKFIRFENSSRCIDGSCLFSIEINEYINGTRLL
ncbi:Hypothetical predicted protein [Paramuricea clavata]|uniref:Uncharacterized protein n=1 Tax=Paramuricea clavata TaxID=317549 RepID=A0A6S7FLW6_PARCT|nr:Hypothetical predicted protein [Paramuricea clavata]